MSQCSIEFTNLERIVFYRTYEFEKMSQCCIERGNFEKRQSVLWDLEILERAIVKLVSVVDTVKRRKLKHAMCSFKNISSINFLINLITFQIGERSVNSYVRLRRQLDKT